MQEIHHSDDSDLNVFIGILRTFIAISLSPLLLPQRLQSSLLQEYCTATLVYYLDAAKHYTLE